MPETADHARERKALAREATRRREAVRILKLAEETCGYAALQLGNGLGPDEARAACLEMAGGLTALAGSLRKAPRLRPEQRRAAARLLAGKGWPVRRVAEQLGVCERTARYYLAAGESPRARRKAVPRVNRLVFAPEDLDAAHSILHPTTA